MSAVRSPEGDERAAVRRALVDLYDEEAASVAQLDERLFVVESYTTDSPGYTGPVAVLLNGDGGATVFGLFQDEVEGRVETAEPLK